MAHKNKEKNTIMKWIKFKNTYGELDTFKSGTLLKLKDGEIIIVGDVNKNLGHCDCCTDRNVEYFCNDYVKQVEKIKRMLKMKCK